MINDDTARAMGIRFLEHRIGLEEYADMLENEWCLDRVFLKMVKNLGKKRVRELYFELPEQLRRYVLIELLYEELTDKFVGLDREYRRVRVSKRPERCKDFLIYLQELQKVLFKFLVSEKGG